MAKKKTTPKKGGRKETLYRYVVKNIEEIEVEWVEEAPSAGESQVSTDTKEETSSPPFEMSNAEVFTKVTNKTS